MAMAYGSGVDLAWAWSLVLAAGAVVVGWAVTRGGSPTPVRVRRSADHARDLLRERYVRGEITEEQLRRALRALDER